MVDAAILNLFFQLKIKEVLELELVGRKLVVITGHSTGGAVAALTALWLLSQTSLPSFRVFCITFGSPLLGNQSLSTSISRSRLAHNFCHVVSIHDLVPRSSNEQFWPFGTFLFCSDNGGVCLDNADSVRRMFHILNATGTPNIEEHQRYGHYVFTLSHMFLKSRSFLSGNIPDNSYQACVALAVEALGFSNDDTSGVLVKECIETATRIVRAPILRSAALANDLASVLPARLEIQWYKDRCDASEEELGYYDFFKRYSLKRDFKVNMSRIRLAQFWDKVVEMVETNELPFDFHLGKKWVYASQFYQLLAEPLDIANFYKNRDIKSGGHYLDQGNRPKRYEVIDKWQKGVAKPEKCERSIYTSTTQDTCFWAKLEEVKECLDEVIKESSDAQRRSLLWEKIVRFERYANTLVKKKEVSKDVKAKNSSYSVWVENLREFKVKMGYVNEIEMAAYRLPNECIRELDKTCSAFLWSGTELRSHKAKVSWENVCKPKMEGGLGLRSLKEANKVCCLKLIWRIVSHGDSLWVKWIHMYLLKKVSFWAINNRTTAGSWIWKKLIKHRDVAKQFCKVEVGNGELTSFWYDSWSSLSRLVDIAGARGVIDLGISHSSTLAAAWVNRRRRTHRADHLNAMEEAMHLQWQQRSDKKDTALWRGKNDVFRPQFSTKDTWNHIRTTSNTVAWHRGIWFAHATPKYSFCMWLAIQNRLSTGDRMLKWRGGATGMCVLCKNCIESRNHLFFECDFSSTVWAALARGLLKSRYTTDWQLLIDIISTSHFTKVETFLTRYVIQAVVYAIWRERNGRRHGESAQTAALITAWVDKQIRNRISAIRLMGDKSYTKAYQFWIQTRD